MPLVQGFACFRTIFRSMRLHIEPSCGERSTVALLLGPSAVKVLLISRRYCDICVVVIASYCPFSSLISPKSHVLACVPGSCLDPRGLIKRGRQALGLLSLLGLSTYMSTGADAQALGMVHNGSRCSRKKNKGTMEPQSPKPRAVRGCAPCSDPDRTTAIKMLSILASPGNVLLHFDKPSSTGDMEWWVEG